MNARQYDEAISRYSAALSLSTTTPLAQALLIKRSTAYAAGAMWEDALNDANEACHFPYTQVCPC